MTERSEVRVTVVCSLPSSEPLTGASWTIDLDSLLQDRGVHR